jgi:hypothetical protein
MARYGLILKDDSYVKLVNIASSKGVTLGRLFNDIIEDYLVDNKPVDERSCLYCEKQPEYRVIMNGRVFFMCEAHYIQNKQFLEGYKQLEE